LPKTFKVGKKNTAVGTVIYIEIDKSAITAGLPERFNFDIVLRDTYPFQSPLVLAKTKIGNSCLNDGRDLLLHLLPQKWTEWTPNMNLHDVIS
jgi:ubiquitin-protein ligase